MPRDEFLSQPVADETSCGIWIFKGPLLQRLATKKVYVFLYGLLGCIFSACYAYFNGTITTIEKRFKIPSRTTGIISVGNDISQLMFSAVLSYYAGKGHRPRWIAFGMYVVSLFCVLNTLPHFIYGPGEDALMLTKRNSLQSGNSSNFSTIGDLSTLCRSDQMFCDSEGGIVPPIILFVAQFISGIGGSLYYTLGVSYMDDNIKKEKTPALVSCSYFIRMLGPPIGYGLVGWCLGIYISPTETPIITKSDPRWLGAWWLGWIILAVVMIFLSTLIALFPKTLPRAALRRQQASEKKLIEMQPEKPPSLSDMLKTCKVLISNKVFMCNNFSAIFYFMGYMPYWIYMPKYIETMFKVSASSSSMITGTVGLVFSAAGILISGLVITYWKPRARPLAMWNVVVGAVSVAGILSYALLGCMDPNDSSFIANQNSTAECNSQCNCTFVKYSPVCAGDKTFISPCHAGCTDRQKINGTTLLLGCTCSSEIHPEYGRIARVGPCPMDCETSLYIFLVIMCILKFFGATGRASNFLVSVRCVEEKDKPISMGFSLMLMSMFAFIPSPILFGYIIDTTCLIWGKTCDGGTGNCWKYNGEQMRYVINITAAVFVTIGTLLDLGVWYFVKNLAIFDEHMEELKDMKQPETNGVNKQPLATHND